MQEILGWILMVVIVLFSGLIAWYSYDIDVIRIGEGYSTRKKLLLLIPKTILFFLLAYFCLAIICGVAWLIAWVGILIREVLQWFYEMVFTPFRVIFS